jgi:ketosteroid isomerase-like protein
MIADRILEGQGRKSMTRWVTATAVALCISALLLAPAYASEPEKERIAKVIDDSIGWFKTKDFDLLFSVFADDPDLFMFQPGSTGTIHGIEAFRELSAIWRDPDTKYLSHEVSELRIGISRSGDVAWFSAILQDCGEYEGRAGCWKDARWTGVLEKRDERWVIVQTHFSFAADKVREELRKEG